MKTKEKTFKGITLWIDNKVANKTFVTSETLVYRFKTWLVTKELNWLEYYWFEAVVRSFLTDKVPGCQGTFEERDFQCTYDLLKPIAEAYMKSKGR